MKIAAVGIDLAKTVLQIHGVDERGKVMVRKQLKRTEVAKNEATWLRLSCFFSTVLPRSSTP